MLIRLHIAKPPDGYTMYPAIDNIHEQVGGSESNRSHVPKPLFNYLCIVSHSRVTFSIKFQNISTIAEDDIGDRSNIPRLCGAVDLTNFHFISFVCWD